MKIIVKGSLVNCSDLSNPDFLLLLHQNNKNLEYYFLQPQSGKIVSACLDWAIIGEVASVLSIISSIWNIYSKLHTQNRSRTLNNSIVINVNGSNNSIMLGVDIKSRKELEKLMRSHLKEHSSNLLKEEIDNIRMASNWQKL